MTHQTNPKPTPRRILKARAKRAESALVPLVREQCVDRDGYCRLAGVARFGPCSGPSQWAHHHEKSRAKTRNMAPEERHDRRWTFMMCQGHHEDGLYAYDLNRMDIEMLTERGADGPMQFTARETGVVYVEVR